MVARDVELTDYLDLILLILLVCRAVGISRRWKARVLVDYAVAIGAFRLVSIPDML